MFGASVEYNRRPSLFTILNNEMSQKNDNNDSHKKEKEETSSIMQSHVVFAEHNKLNGLPFKKPDTIVRMVKVFRRNFWHKIPLHVAYE